MKASTTRLRHKKILDFLIPLVFWLAVWQLAYLAVGQDLLLASPWKVARRIGQLAGTLSFWQTIAYSVARIGLGFLLGSGLGVLLGIVTAYSPVGYRLISPAMGIIKATPVASFIILALVWISSRNLSVFISLLMVLPLVWSNVHQGLLQVDPLLMEMAQVFSLSTVAKFRHILLPSVLPYLLSAIQVAMGFAWKSGIAAEVLAIPRGAVGTQLYYAKIYLETTDLFAWTAVIILISMAIERGMVFLLKRGLAGCRPLGKKGEG